MEKESVKKFDLEAAFKALDEIEIPQTKGIKANRVDLKERFSHKSAHETLIEDYYDVSSNEDLTEAQEEREGEVAQAKLARIEKIVDLDAETADDLLPSYVGKVIMQCPQCMTLFYKNPEDIEHSDENPDIVNLNEPCQHCGNTSGYTLIGKVDSVSEDEADSYETAESGEPTEESELDLDFGEPTEEVSPEGEGEGAEEMSDEELSDDELKELELDLEEIPEEEPEEEKKEESLNLSKEAPSDFETEHKSENLTLNEEAANESLNNSEELKDAEEGSELKTENESENLTLNEDVDKDLDAKLKAHNDYIAYLQQMIKQEEEALKKAENDEIKAAIQRRLDAFTADLEAALPDAVKEEASVEEVAEEPVIEKEPTEAQAEEEPKEEPAEEESPVEEALTEDGAEEEKPAEGNEVDYVEYKHSYCHALAPKLKAINYLVNVKKVEPKILKGYILKLLKDADVKWTEKEKEFKKNIEEKEDVYDILNYVKNSIEKAKTIKVKVDENGELVEGLNEGFEGCLYEVLTESLNKSEAAVSENETENESENLTLNEDVSSEIDSIIASWGDVSESLTEEGDLDKLLDSDEFKTPVSEEEINAAKEDAAKEESLEECGKKLTEEPEDQEVMSIIDSWSEDDEKKEEGYTGNPAERTTHLEYTDDDPTDGKAVLPKNIEKQLTEDEEVPVEEPVEDEEAAEEEPKEELPNVDFNTEEVKEVAQEAAEEVIKEAEAEVEPEVVEEKVEEVVADAVEEKVKTEEAPVEGEEIPAEDIPAEEPIEEDINITNNDSPSRVDNRDQSGKEETDEGLLSGVAGLANGLSKGIEDVPVVGPLLASDEAEKKEVKEGVGLFGIGDVNVNLDASGQNNAVGVGGGEGKTEGLVPDLGNLPLPKLPGLGEELDDLDEASFNEHINEFLKEVYSNVKSFEATSCELKENKLIVEGKISFNSGREKLTIFEFLPNYGEGKLFFEGYNKDFSADKAFTLNCSINESKELITESFGYKYTVNEVLVEGLK